MFLSLEMEIWNEIQNKFQTRKPTKEGNQNNEELGENTSTPS